MFSISARTGGGVLPPIFVNKFTQKRDAAGDIIPRPGLSTTSNQFIGVQIEAGGEAAELEVYKYLGKSYRLISTFTLFNLFITILYQRI